MNLRKRPLRQRSELWSFSASDFGQQLVGTIAMLIVINLFTVYFISAEKTVYIWSKQIYWSSASELAEGIYKGQPISVKSFIDSVLHDDYNVIPAMPIAAAMSIVGDSRLAYILCVTNIYVFLAMLTLCWGAKELGGPWAEKNSLCLNWAPLMVLLLFPSFLLAVLMGWLDVGVVVPAIIVFVLYFRYPPDRAPLWILVTMGLLLTLMVLFRRYYSIWVFSFMVMILVDAVWVFWHGREFSFRKVMGAMRTPFIIGSVFLLSTVLLRWPWIRERVFSGYAADTRAWYLYDSLGQALWYVVQRFGLVPLCILVVSVVDLVWNPKKRRIGILLTVQLVVSYLVMREGFTDHGDQHWYLHFPTAMLIVSLFLMELFSRIRAGWQQWALGGVLIAVGLTASLSVFSATAAPLLKRAEPLLPEIWYYPKVRKDVPELTKLLSLLDNLVDNKRGTIYVLASSGTMSDEVLRHANKSLGLSFRSSRQVVSASHVDIHHRYPSRLLTAQYVVVAWPPVTHLRPKEQRVITIPAESFMHNRNIAKAFRRLPGVFRIEEGREVFVFEKTRPISDSELEELSNLLRQAYPERPDIYLPRRK